jgi:hypothetical protein
VSGKRGKTTAAGYGWKHQQARQRFAREVTAGLARCARCGEPIAPGSKWDLDHRDDRQGYNGPAHVSCNRSHGRGRPVAERSGLFSEREWASLSERERDWRSGDLNPRRRHSREW